MKSNMLLLTVPSLIAFVILCIHMIKTKGKVFFLWFVGSGLLFGSIRSQIIHYIQLTLNHSYIPYEFSGKLLKIGNDSLVVYVGWIIVAYLSWQLAEIIIKKQKPEKEGQFLPIISLSFFIISAISYLNETAASVAGWWSWNKFLESGFSDSLFVNVPWVGIVDWATVSFEYLAIFLGVRQFTKKRDWKYLLVFLLPIAHWTSHISAPSLNISVLGATLTPSVIIHFLLPAVAVALWRVKSSIKLDLSGGKNNYIYAALGIIMSVCTLALLIYGNEIGLFVSLVPLSLFVFIALHPRASKQLFIVATLLVALAFLYKDNLAAQRLVIALYPVAVFALYQLPDNISFNYNKSNLKTVALITLSFIILGAVYVGGNTQRPSKATSKVILITLDTVPANHVGAYGYGKPTTPNFDKFTKENIFYQNAYSPIPYTYPAHYSLMSGAHPQTTRVSQNGTSNSRTNASPAMLAEQFKAQGYKTSAFVSSSVLGHEEMRKGFDIYNLGDMKSSTKATSNRRSAKETNTAALKWLDENKEGGSFTWIHYYDAHSPYRNSCGGPNFSKGLKPQNIIFNDTNLIENHRKKIRASNEDIRYLSTRYDEGLFCLDKEFGNLLDSLKELDIYEDATIIVVGDHGENFDHNSYFHGDNIYEPAIKIPMAIKIDDTKKTIAEEVSLLDIYPSLIDYFDLTNLTPEMDGYNILGDKFANELYFQTTTIEPVGTKQIESSKPTIMGILQGDKKIIQNKKLPIYESYNLSNDVLEIDSLGAKINNFDNLSSLLKIYFDN